MSVLRIQYIDADQDLDPGSTLEKMESKPGFLQYLVDILPLRSGSFNSHIFVEMLRI